MASRYSRRIFMKRSAAAAAATTLASQLVGPFALAADNVNTQKLRIGFVGTAGRADFHVGNLIKAMSTEVCPCYTDVDKSHWKKIAGSQPNAKSYTDYRQMFDKHEKDMDAVFIAVPDHSHACAAVMAMNRGIHTYCEKPLTWSVVEARKMAQLAREKKLATQMGNHGHANQGNRRVVEWVTSGVLGDITEVHTWTNRPIWKQGLQERPASKPVPAGLDWDSWIGPAPMREYHDNLHPFAWRGWKDFGCGAIGDMGCHTWDCVFWSMQPDYPESIELINAVSNSKEQFPSRSKLEWKFPAKGKRPAFTATWAAGGIKPDVPEEMKNDPYYNKRGPAKLPSSASIFIGTKGKMLVEGDYGDSPRLIPESFMTESKEMRDKITKIEASPGHREEFIMACRGEKPINFPKSNFADYSAHLTEVMLLGSLAIREGEEGKKMELDPATGNFKDDKYTHLLSREYRKGWEL